jgi:hypothetical protein
MFIPVIFFILLPLLALVIAPAAATLIGLIAE